MFKCSYRGENPSMTLWAETQSCLTVTRGSPRGSVDKPRTRRMNIRILTMSQTERDIVQTLPPTFKFLGSPSLDGTMQLRHPSNTEPYRVESSCTVLCRTPSTSFPLFQALLHLPSLSLSRPLRFLSCFTQVLPCRRPVEYQPRSPFLVSRGGKGAYRDET